MLIFSPISQYQPGILYEIIYKSYAELIDKYSLWKGENEKWKAFDKNAFKHPDTIGNCVFISCFNHQPIGLGSFDPRHGSEYGIIGQNCIIPEFRNRGFGKQQILEILKRFKKRKIKKVSVTTSEHPFFIPAQQMYLSLGFKEISRKTGGPDPKYKTIQYGKTIEYTILKSPHTPHH